MRIMVFNRNTRRTAYGNNMYAAEVDERNIVSATTHDELNGEHSLTLVTTQVIEKGTRLLVVDNYGTDSQEVAEYAVVGVDAEHASGKTTVGTYYCVWSIQEDLSGVIVSVMPGVQTPTEGWRALDSLLSTQGRWARDTTQTMTALGGASMYDMSAWDAISVLLKNWGGEIDVKISLDSQTGVSSREVVYKDQIGRHESVVPRVDFGDGVSSIKRTLSDSQLICRISPRGKGEATESGGYGRKITIESVNSGRDYLEYEPMRDIARIKNPDGTFIYPTVIVENQKCETPANLKTWAEASLADFCTLEAVYEVDAAYIQSQTGEPHLGDDIQVVDSSFAGEPLYLESRIIAIDRDLLNPRSKVYTVGATRESIAAKFSALSGSIASGSSGDTSQNVSNDLYIGGDLFVAGAINGSGAVESTATQNMNIAHYTNTNICSVSLSPGIWLVTGRIRFETNTTGHRTAKISTVSADTSSVISTTMMPAFTGMWTHVTAIRCLSLASQTTVYLVGWQNSGSTLECNGEMECTKVG